MSELRYSRPALHRDYARAGAGLAMCAGLVLLMPQSAIAFWPVVATAVLFLAFAGLTVLKQWTVIEMDDRGVRRNVGGPIGGLFPPRNIEFAALDGLVLRYFGRRRARGKGIVELTIRAGRERLTVDDALEGFDALVTLAHRSAERRGIALDPATSANLASSRFG